MKGRWDPAAFMKSHGEHLGQVVVDGHYTTITMKISDFFREFQLDDGERKREIKLKVRYPLCGVGHWGYTDLALRRTGPHVATSRLFSLNTLSASWTHFPCHCIPGTMDIATLPHTTPGCILQPRMRRLSQGMSPQSVTNQISVRCSQSPSRVFPRRLAGPKMYIATRDEKNMGSTRLHMDVTSAVNLMLHTIPSSEGARWDIFLGADTDKLREYLRIVRKKAKSKGVSLADVEHDG